MNAIILAAGRGTRLKPVTDHVPKPLIPFFGKAFLEYTLDEIHGLVDEIVLVVHHHGDKIRAALGEDWRGVPLRYVWQEQLRGSGDALLQARDHMTSPTLVILGDVYVARESVELMLNTGSEYVLSAAYVDDPENHLGVRSEAGRVTGVFVDSAWVDRGVWLLAPRILDYLDGTPWQNGELRIMRVVERMVGAGCPIAACMDEQPWIQIGDHSGVEGVLEAMKFFCGLSGRANAAAPVDVGGVDVAIADSVVFGPGQIEGGTISRSLVYVGGAAAGVTLHDEIAAVGVAHP